MFRLYLVCYSAEVYTAASGIAGKPQYGHLSPEVSWKRGGKNITSMIATDLIYLLGY